MPRETEPLLPSINYPVCPGAGSQLMFFSTSKLSQPGPALPLPITIEMMALSASPPLVLFKPGACCAVGLFQGVAAEWETERAMAWGEWMSGKAILTFLRRLLLVKMLMGVGVIPLAPGRNFSCYGSAYWECTKRQHEVRPGAEVHTQDPIAAPLPGSSD